MPRKPKGNVRKTSRKTSIQDKDKGGMNKYQVMGVIGEGAYGVVMKCRHKKTGDYVAMKKFKESGEKDEAVRKTIFREIKVLKLMGHAKDSVVQLLETFRRKGRLYLVFEYIERNLLEVLEENPDGMPPFLIERYIYQLCAAIDVCHQMQVLHRDIKPENLLIDANDRLKLCDFGFARQVDKYGEKLTDYVATRWYRPPELLVGDERYGPGVDIWAIACIMGELSDGDPLFPGDSEIDQLFIIQKLLGPITKEHLRVFLDNPRFMGLRFPDMSHPDTLPSRYSQVMTAKALFFMKHALHMDPRKRPTAAQCMQDPYFNGVRSMYPLTKHQTKATSPTMTPAKSPSKSPRVNDGLSPSPSRYTSATASNTTLDDALTGVSPTSRSNSATLGSAGAELFGAGSTTPRHKKMESFSIGSSAFPTHTQSTLHAPPLNSLHGLKQLHSTGHSPPNGDMHRRTVSESLGPKAAKQVASFAQLTLTDPTFHHGVLDSSFPGIDDPQRGHSIHGMSLGLAGASSPPMMGHQRKVSSDFSTDKLGEDQHRHESKNLHSGEFYKKTTAFSFGIHD